MGDNADFFWQNVKKLIKTNKTTQEWLASRCGVSLGVLQGWIYNKRFPDALQSVRIAQALGTTVEYLVTGETHNPDSEKLDQLKKEIERLSKLV